ncbi:hypothetical protein [Thiohalocapsa halophila]|uniref:hypothetical protein n=1 Tax=Thiohalocapsa halophila TaxID=69359 RepID=UPI0019061418
MHQRQPPSEHRLAECRWLDDPGSPDMAALQQACAAIAGDEVIHIAGFRHRYQKRPERQAR